VPVLVLVLGSRFLSDVAKKVSILPKDQEKSNAEVTSI
jgi:hypothetical protein